jgi:hypothetical protein
MDPRVLYTLGKCSSPQPHPQASFNTTELHVSAGHRTRNTGGDMTVPSPGLVPVLKGGPILVNESKQVKTGRPPYNVVRATKDAIRRALGLGTITLGGRAT